MIHRSAEFSLDRMYRRRLDRWWGNGPRVGWFMLNPSTAGEDRDDNTITKCIGFTARWGFDGLMVVNPFDLVMTDSRHLPNFDLACTDRNSAVIDAVASDVELLIVAWGCEDVVRRMVKRGLDPMEHMRRIRRNHPNLPIECLGISKTGCPYHPLMLAYSTPRVPFEVRED
ncbi:DUF1643 domain-containing protein [Acidobacteria bacterium AB60]|nr:DUF1643 domain-containing protein [Acidobacteria bacterium AB60]